MGGKESDKQDVTLCQPIQTYKRPQNLNSIYLLALKRKLILRCKENIIKICLIEAAVQTIE